MAAITVDPSRRLSQVLEQSTSSDHNTSKNQWQKNLDVYYVDTEKSFSDFVSGKMRADYFQRLSGNPIYQQISKNLRETHNFAALYRMHQILETKDYDLVVLDTPPCHQVVDFFESPQRLERFFSTQLGPEADSWLGWVKNQGVKVAEKVVQGLVGEDFVREMDAFFRGIGDLKDEIALISKNFRSHLTDSHSHMALLFSSAADKLDEARYLAQQIERNAYPVNSYIMNRAFIPGLDTPSPSVDRSGLEGRLYQAELERKQNNKKIMQQLREDLGRNGSYVLLPELMIPLSSQEGVSKFVTQMERHWFEVDDGKN